MATRLTTIRFPKRTDQQLDELADLYGDRTKTIVVAVDRLYQTEITERSESMNTEQMLSDYLKDEGDRRYRYIGTIWGDEPYEASGAEFASLIDDLDFNGPMADVHPAYGHRSYDDDGQMIGEYYATANTISYTGHLIEEDVLEAIDD